MILEGAEQGRTHEDSLEPTLLFDEVFGFEVWNKNNVYPLVSIVVVDFIPPGGTKPIGL